MIFDNKNLVLVCLTFYSQVELTEVLPSFSRDPTFPEPTMLRSYVWNLKLSRALF